MIIFRALEKEHLMEVIDLEVAKLATRLKAKGITLVLDQSAKEHLVAHGFEPEMGARKLRRTIEQQLEDPLAEKLLLDGNAARKLLVSFDEGKLLFLDQELELATEVPATEQ